MHIPWNSGGRIYLNVLTTLTCIKIELLIEIVHGIIGTAHTKLIIYGDHGHTKKQRRSQN